MTAGRPPFPEVDSPRVVGRASRDTWPLAIAFVLIGGLVLWTFVSFAPSSERPQVFNETSTQWDSVALIVTAIAKLEPLAWTATPTPTSTATATPVPTSTQQAVWQPDPCGSPEPGQLCRVPDRAPPTPTPYPSCYEMPEPGKWCRWPTVTPSGRTETR